MDKICDGNGQVIGEEDGVMERWKEYFSGLLQGGQEEESPKKAAGLCPMYEEDSIGIEEVVEAIAKLKSGKAPGVCGIERKC